MPRGNARARGLVDAVRWGLHPVALLQTFIQRLDGFLKELDALLLLLAQKLQGVVLIVVLSRQRDRRTLIDIQYSALKPPDSPAHTP